MAKGIVIQIQGSGEGAAEALRMIEAKMQETAEKGSAMSEQLKAAGETIRSAFEMVGVGFGIREAVDSFREMISSSMELAVQIKHMSEQTGISTENLSVLKYMSDETGVSFETLSKGFKKLSTSMFELTAGGAGAGLVKKSFEALGITSKDLADTDGDLLKVMELIADKMKDMPDGYIKSAASTELLGRAGRELIPILDQGGDAVEEFRAKAESLGLVLDATTIDKMEELHKSVASMKGAFSGLGLEITAFLAPALQGMAEGISGVIQASKISVGQTLKGMLGAALEGTPWSSLGAKWVSEASEALTNIKAVQDNIARMTAKPEKAPRTGDTGDADDHGSGSIGGATSSVHSASAAVATDWEGTYQLTAGIVEHMHEMVADARELDQIEGQQAWDKLKTDATAHLGEMFKAKPPSVALVPDKAAKQPSEMAQDAAGESGRVVSGFLTQLSEESLRGKVNFKGLVDSALMDIDRWAMGILERQWIIPMLNSMFGITGTSGASAAPAATASAPHLAAGGDINDGGWAVVGDGGDGSGAELFAPKGPGTVLPHDVLEGIASAKSGGGGAPNVSVNVINNSSAQVSASPAGVSWDGEARQFVIHTVLEDMNQGGPLAGAMSGFART